MERVLCDICGVRVEPHAHYCVRIDVFADPSLPSVTSEELEEQDFDYAFAQLIEQMKHMTAEELQDQVHRRFEYRLCPACQRQFIANPLGLPRRRKSAHN
jgi:hypothetical protein